MTPVRVTDVWQIVQGFAAALLFAGAMMGLSATSAPSLRPSFPIPADCNLCYQGNVPCWMCWINGCTCIPGGGAAPQATTAKAPTLK